jgi:hypothetical protein
MEKTAPPMKAGLFLLLTGLTGNGLTGQPDLKYHNTGKTHADAAAV